MEEETLGILLLAGHVVRRQRDRKTGGTVTGFGDQLSQKDTLAQSACGTRGCSMLRTRMTAALSREHPATECTVLEIL